MRIYLNDFPLYMHRDFRRCGLSIKNDVNKPQLAIILIAVCIYGIMIGLFFWTISEYNRAIPIDSSSFPDPVLREYVRNRADLNGSGRLNDDERDYLEEIVLPGKEVESLEGIGLFPNLKILECKNNNLKTLDLSKNSRISVFII